MSPKPSIFVLLPGPAGVYFVVCMALLVISLTETVLIVRLVHKQDLQPPVPHWVKYLVLERAPVLFCIHKKHRFCARLSSQASELDHSKENNYGTGKVYMAIDTASPIKVYINLILLHFILPFIHSIIKTSGSHNN